MMAGSATGHAASMRLVAIDVAGRDGALVADRCWQAGATGVWERDDQTVRIGVEEPDLTAFLAATADLGPVDVTDEEMVELSGRWASVTVADRDVELWVPATVFGDGHHPTTATCLDLLPSVMAAGTQVLDVGCGAGALSIAAALLDGEVTAIDVDPAAVAATLENAERNGVAVEASARPLADMVGPYDLVLANMTVGALEPLVDDLIRTTIAGGSMVLSGMLESHWPRIRDAAAGTAGPVRSVDGWVTAIVTVV